MERTERLHAVTLSLSFSRTKGSKYLWDELDIYLFTQHQSALTNALEPRSAQIPTTMCKNGGCYNSKGGGSICLLMILQWDIQQLRCQTDIT